MKRRLLVMIPALAGLVVIVPVKVFASSGRQMGPGGRMRPGGQAATMTRTMATPTRTPGMERHATATPGRGGYTMMPSMGRRASMQAMGPGAAMPGMHGLDGARAHETRPRLGLPVRLCRQGEHLQSGGSREPTLVRTSHVRPTGQRCARRVRRGRELAELQRCTASADSMPAELHSGQRHARVLAGAVRLSSELSATGGSLQ